MPIVVRCIGDIDVDGSIEVGDPDSLLGADVGDGCNVCLRARSSLVLAGPLIARSRLLWPLFGDRIHIGFPSLGVVLDFSWRRPFLLLLHFLHSSPSPLQTVTERSLDARGAVESPASSPPVPPHSKGHQRSQADTKTTAPTHGIDSVLEILN